MHFDVFNGDADGIFALHQLRLARPVPEAELITGVKRDISLLERIRTTRDASVSTLDISLDKNRDALLALLANNNRILYIDHHYAGDIPKSGNLEHHIEPSAKTCTSMIVNSLLNNAFPGWAACGAYGDNLHEQGNQLAQMAGATEEETAILQDIGEMFNYNGYGARIEDLHFHPAELYRAVQPHDSPLRFYDSSDIVARLKKGYKEDMARAIDQKNLGQRGPNRIYRLPAASWSRRIAGVFSNLKAREQPQGAHAIIVENDDSTLQISVRAPLSAKTGAETLCRSFPTGGGRAAAAGINHLPADMLDEFIESFEEMFSKKDNQHSIL